MAIKDQDLIDQLWDLVDDWQRLAEDKVIQLPFLSSNPRIAHSQGLNTAADALGEVLLNWVP